MSDLPETRRSSILSCSAWILSPAREAETCRLTSSATSANGFTVEGVMPLTRTITGPNWLFSTPLTPPCGSANTASASALSSMASLVVSPRSVSSALRPRVLDQVVEARAGLDLRLGRAGVGLVGEQDLLQVALLGRAEPRILAGDLLVGGLGVGVADLGRIGDRVRLERQDVDRAIFGRAVARLAIVEEGLERLIGGRGESRPPPRPAAGNSRSTGSGPRSRPPPSPRPWARRCRSSARRR